MSIVTIEIKKNPAENGTSVLRRFTRKVQDSGMLPKVKSKRYNDRALSKLAGKKSALKKIEKTKVIKRLEKLGKIIPNARRRR